MKTFRKIRLYDEGSDLGAASASDVLDELLDDNSEDTEAVETEQEEEFDYKEAFKKQQEEIEELKKLKELVTKKEEVKEEKKEIKKGKLTEEERFKEYYKKQRAEEKREEILNKSKGYDLTDKQREVLKNIPVELIDDIFEGLAHKKKIPDTRKLGDKTKGGKSMSSVDFKNVDDVLDFVGIE